MIGAMLATKRIAENNEIGAVKTVFTSNLSSKKVSTILYARILTALLVRQK